MRYWGVLLATVAVTWVAGEGWRRRGGAARDLIVPAAVCVAVLVGLGVASIAREVSGSRLGWRQLATIGFSVLALGGLLPVLVGLGGRWNLPEIGYDSVITAPVGPQGANTLARGLRLGAPLALPLAGWQIRPGFAEALTLTGLPDRDGALADGEPRPRRTARRRRHRRRARAHGGARQAARQQRGRR